ncbi:MAG: hypothetical protein DA328_01950 [Nitrososphaeraceae archaeon]|nr:hypothetical protein [Nitrososphaeraceae archaeon]
MEKKSAAIYLAHLNPLTNSHVKIIQTLLDREYVVYVFPVIFLKNGIEVNTKSFPFSYEVRKMMIRSVFGDEVRVQPEYTFTSPFIKYLPPLLSPISWKIRNNILKPIKESNFISYTGDRAERYVLSLYRLNPIKSSRLEISASKVKEMIFKEIEDSSKQNNKIDEDSVHPKSTFEKNIGWEHFVPKETISIIKQNWKNLEMFVRSKDETIKIMGMKLPKEGLL